MGGKGRRIGVSVAALAALAAAAPAPAGHLCTGPPPHQCSHDPPTASFTWSPENPQRGETVTFSGTATANPDRSIERVGWDLDDDGSFDDGAQLTVQQAFPPGTFTIRLRVEDDEGDSAVATRQITVTRPPRPPAEIPRPASSLTFQANALRDGFLDTPSPAPPLARKWSRELGTRVSYPVVADGRVFVTADDENTLGTAVIALDRRTGRILWWRNAGETFGSGRSHVTYDAGRLYLETSSGTVQALDPATGASLWARQQSQDRVSHVPLAHGGQVWTSGSGIGGTMYALDGAAGDLLWVEGIGNDSGPAADGRNVYVAHDCEGVTALDRIEGYVDWKGGTPLCGSGGGSGRVPVVHDGRVYARQDRSYDSTGGWVVRTEDGAEIGKFTAEEPPVFKGDVGLFLHNRTLTARNVASGADMWTFTGDGKLVTAPLIVGGVAYVGSESGRVYGLELGTGRQVWSDVAGKELSSSREGGLTSGLAAGEGSLFVPSGGTLTAFAAPEEDARPAPDRPPPALTGIPAPAPSGGASVAHQVNPHHDGFLNVATPAPPLRRRWTQRVGENAGYPIVAEGKAFGYDRRGHTVHAFDLATGKTLWTRETKDEGIYSNIHGTAYDDGKLFVVSGGQMFAFRASDGTELWRTDESRQGVVRDPPTAADGLVLAAGECCSIVAIRQSDGQRMWSSPTVGSSGAPAVADGRAFVSHACLNASAHAMATGERVWSIHPIGCSGGGGTTPAVHGGRLYALENSGIFALDPGSGSILDTFSSDRSPAFAGSAAVMLNGKVLQAVDLATGNVIWNLIGAGLELRTAPLIVGRHVYVGASDGSVFAIRLDTGAPVWFNPKVDAPYPPGQTYERADHHGFAAGEGHLVTATTSSLVAYGPHGGLAVDARAIAKRLAKASRRVLLRRRGLVVDVEALGPGRVEVRVESTARGRPALLSGSAKPLIAGTVPVLLRATKLGRRALARGRRIRATVRVRWVPRKGKARSATRKVTLLG
ncbi:MAG: PQQ-binding-like beta-propeller repeat protein [Actinomycetota bacterium]|nr:PQQ-binding-like beta-propeller repeat protein [Actinomycetota bacterium]